MLDEYIRLVIENDSLTAFFAFEDKAEAQNRFNFFKDLYVKLSPKYIVQYVEAILRICKTEEERIRAIKMILAVPLCSD